MKRNTLLLIILAVLVGGALLVQQGKEKSLNTATNAVKLRELLLPDLPANDVRKFHIQDGPNQVNVSYADGKWLVAERDNYPASFDKIHRFLTSLAEMKVAGGQVVKKDGRAALKLQTPDESQAGGGSGLQVELYNEKGTVLASLVAGKNVESSGGASAGSFSGPAEQRFIRVATDGEMAWLVNDAMPEVQATPQDWLDKEFLDVRKLKDVTITQPVLADSWSAERKDENSEFTLGDVKQMGDALDTAKASALTALLSSPNFNDVITKDKITPDFMKGAIAAKIDTFEDFHYDVRVLEKRLPGTSEPNYYFTCTVSADMPKERKAEPNEKPEDKKKKDDEFAKTKQDLEDKLAREKTYNGRTYDVPNYAITILLKKRSEVLRDKPKPPPTPQVHLPNGVMPPHPADAPAPAAPAPVEAASPPAAPAPSAPVSPPPAAPEPAKPDAAKK